MLWEEMEEVEEETGNVKEEDHSGWVDKSAVTNASTYGKSRGQYVDGGWKDETGTFHPSLDLIIFYVLFVCFLCMFGCALSCCVFNFEVSSPFQSNLHVLLCVDHGISGMEKVDHTEPVVQVQLQGTIVNNGRTIGMIRGVGTIGMGRTTTTRAIRATRAKAMASHGTATAAPVAVVMSVV